MRLISIHNIDDTEKFGSTLEQFLRSDSAVPADFQARFDKWLRIVEQAENRGLPRYLIDRMKRRIPRAVKKKSSGNLPEYDRRRQGEYIVKAIRLQTEISDLKARRAETLEAIELS